MQKLIKTEKKGTGEMNWNGVFAVGERRSRIEEC